MLGYETRFSDHYSLGDYFDYAFFVVPFPFALGMVDYKIPSDVFSFCLASDSLFACGSFIPVTMIDGEMVQGSASP